MMDRCFSELFFSLGLQCSLLLLTTRWLSSRQNDCRLSDQLWNSCHIIILLSTVAGLLLPHLRILPHTFWPATLVATKQMVAESFFWRTIFVCWSTGALVLTAGLTISLVRTSRIIRGAIPLDTDRISAIGFPASPPIRIFVSPSTRVPFCWQFHRPVIVLPESALQFPADELTAILRHERGHLLEKHPLHLFLQRLVEVLYWFHPWVWKSSRDASLQRELVSDGYAAANPGDTACLLRGLYRLAACQDVTPHLPAGSGFITHGAAMQARVDALLGRRGAATPRSMGVSRAIMSLMAAVIVSTVWLPIDPSVTRRSVFSPWPPVSAVALRELGIIVRDYEIDSHRTQVHKHVSRLQTPPGRISDVRNAGS